MGIALSPRRVTAWSEAPSCDPRRTRRRIARELDLDHAHLEYDLCSVRQLVVPSAARRNAAVAQMPRRHEAVYRPRIHAEQALAGDIRPRRISSCDGNLRGSLLS